MQYLAQRALDIIAVSRGSASQLPAQAPALPLPLPPQPSTEAEALCARGAPASFSGRRASGGHGADPGKAFDGVRRYRTRPRSPAAAGNSSAAGGGAAEEPSTEALCARMGPTTSVLLPFLCVINCAVSRDTLQGHSMGICLEQKCIMWCWCHRWLPNPCVESSSLEKVLEWWLSKLNFMRVV